MTWLGDIFDRFNAGAGLGNEHSNWVRKLERFGEIPPGTPLHIRSPDDRVEGIGRKLTELMYSELADIHAEERHQQDLLSLSLQAGEVFAGNRAARKLFTSANKSLDMIDTYIGPEVFDMLEVTASTVQIRILTDKVNAPTLQAFNRFRTQFGRVELRVTPTKTIHDRYLIVDDLVAVHLGHSIKDLGSKMAEIKPISVAPTIQAFGKLWNRSQPH